MKNRFAFLLPLVGLVILLSACSPDALEDCFLSTGPLRTKDFSFPNAPSIINVYDNIDVVWHYSPTSYAKLECGRNLISKVEFTLEAETLSIRNRARCNWVRDYSKKMQVDLFCPHPFFFGLNGFGNFSCADTIRSNYFVIHQNGAGESRVKLNAGYVHLRFDSYGFLQGTGKAKEAFFFKIGSGKLETKDIEVDRLQVILEVGDELDVMAKDSLFGEIRNKGKVYYTGNPKLKVQTPKGGKFIKR